MAGFSASSRGPRSLLPIYISAVSAADLLAARVCGGGEVCEGFRHPRSKVYQRDVSTKEQRERERGGEVTVSVSDQIKRRGMEEGFRSIRNNAQRCLQPCFFQDE